MLSSLFFYDTKKFNSFSVIVGQLFVSFLYLLSRGSAVAQLVKALPYKLEGRRIDSRWGHGHFPPHYDPEVDSASNRNKYQGYFLGGVGGR